MTALSCDPDDGSVPGQGVWSCTILNRQLIPTLSTTLNGGAIFARVRSTGLIINHYG
jgi:hypothetical protein